MNEENEWQRSREVVSGNQTIVFQHIHQHHLFLYQKNSNPVWYVHCCKGDGCIDADLQTISEGEAQAKALLFL